MAQPISRRQVLRAGVVTGAVAATWTKPVVAAAQTGGGGSPAEGGLPCIHCIAVSLTNWSRDEGSGHEIEGRIVIDNSGPLATPAIVSNVFAEIKVQNTDMPITSWCNVVDAENSCTDEGCPAALDAGAVIPAGSKCVFLYRATFTGTVPTTGNDQLRHHVFVSFDDPTVEGVSAGCEITANVNVKVTNLAGLPPVVDIPGVVCIGLERGKALGNCCGAGCADRSCVEAAVTDAQANLVEEESTTTTTAKPSGKPTTTTTVAEPTTTTTAAT